MVRAGVVSGRRTALYALTAVVTIALISGATVTFFGLGRVFTGLLLGAFAGLALLIALFRRDSVELTEDAIVRRTPWTADTIAWDRVVAGRFTLDEKSRWSLALDLNGGDELHGELILLSIPPVLRPVANAYDMRKREQVNEIRTMLRHKRVPVTVLPDIAEALSRHWKLAPPTR
ncbi:hypothetical protein [Nocardia huaxiensis]|uniref:PH (Pleckstrin Homology) domain-containing protein n=1 Tax=Nocardia huaxiensis TaxID=2755382 RepID=A0A7D6VNY8_9NOCA|nr:hypothetical protein [Nocardia huaxiensis]QLY34236.1 hypothetical protein H0264_09445 [Nocardia huaxiensis]UFT00123.1 hypothetical protein LPY97_24005 [Nocardia huaxiensis]